MGVKGVVNAIDVKPSHAPNATEIRSGIEGALKRSAEVEARRIQIEIDGSTVILRGNVDTWPERRAAERAAWAAPGVRMVENNLRVGVLAAAAS
jgi:osmotically-inducible protein OsmY